MHGRLAGDAVGGPFQVVVEEAQELGAEVELRFAGVGVGAHLLAGTVVPGPDGQAPSRGRDAVEALCHRVHVGAVIPAAHRVDRGAGGDAPLFVRVGADVVDEHASRRRGVAVLDEACQDVGIPVAGVLCDGGLEQLAVLVFVHRVPGLVGLLSVGGLVGSVEPPRPVVPKAAGAAHGDGKGEQEGFRQGCVKPLQFCFC